MKRAKILSAVLVGSFLLGMTACRDDSAFRSRKYDEVNNIPQITSSVNIVEDLAGSPSSGEVLSDFSAPEKTYQNPILSPARGEGEQFGDPYVLRYNGKYYMYHTASTLNCWESEDLVNWTFAGVCTDNDLFRGSWAPEVEYYNGLFYMTTTGPNGDGDYILTSDSPTGPFEIASSGVETGFDSSIFVDDNNDWYMFFPDTEDICVVRMPSPISVDYWTYKNLGVTVAEDAWTEGPMVIKHKDTYFLTFCGGEVSNTGYQIHYAVSDGDMTNFTRGENYPLMICTDKTTYPGLGHSSLVTGPNLDSLYKVYHSMPWRELPRTMMIDPLYINGDYMQALGPTLSVQQAPDMPDIYSRFDSADSLEGWTVLNAEIVDSQLKIPAGGVVLSEKGINGDFTAEYNFLSIDDVYPDNEAFLPHYGKAGAIFDYKDAENYGAAYIDTEGSKLEIVFTVDGKETVYKEYLHASFEDSVDYSVLQQLVIKKSGSTYTFLFNEKTVGEYESSLTGGAVGVSCLAGTATIGFVGAEGNVWHSSYKELYKPVEGEFGALLCIEDGLNVTSYGKRDYLSVKSGEIYNYYITAEASGNYDLQMRYVSDEGFSFRIYLNGTPVYEGAAAASDDHSYEVYRGIELLQGCGVLTVEITEGSADIFNYKFSTSSTVSESVAVDLSAPVYSEDGWYAENGTLYSSNPSKFLYGDREWGNYSVSATFTPTANWLDARLIFRVTNESLSPKHSITECKNYYMGYNVTLVKGEDFSYVGLYRQNYGETELARYDIDLPLDRPVDVRVDAIDENITVYIDGVPVIEYSDPSPFIKGAVGFSDIATAAVSDLKVEPVNS